MIGNAFWRRLLVAFSDSAPTFHPSSQAASGTLSRRLLVAFSDSAPTFTYRPVLRSPGMAERIDGEELSLRILALRRQARRLPHGLSAPPARVPPWDLYHLVYGLLCTFASYVAIMILLIDMSHSLAIAVSLGRDFGQAARMQHLYELSLGAGIVFSLVGACVLGIVTSRATSRALAAAHPAVVDFSHDLTKVQNAAGTDPATDLAAPLNRAVDLTRSLAAAMDHSRATSLANAIINTVAEIPVDVSRADLSSLSWLDRDLLVDVVWTLVTIWPEGIASRVLGWSREIRPGLYQVTDGTQRQQARSTAMR